MKKLILLLCFLFQKDIIVSAFGCLCVRLKDESFCESVTNQIKFSKNKLYVIKARTVEINQNVATFEVLDVYMGEENRSSITVFRNDFLCPDANFGAVGETFIYILERVDTLVIGDNQGRKIDDYILPPCIFTKLKVESGFIKGNITEAKPQVIEENDLKCTSLSFRKFSIKDTKVVPNPFSNQLTIIGLERNVSFTVFDLTGRVVIDTFISNDRPTIALGQLANGMYIIRMKHLGAVAISKVIKI